MVTITLNNREIPLLYTALEMLEIQEQIAPINQAISLVLGQNPDDPEDDKAYGSAGHLDAVAKLIMILGNAGLEESGKEPDLTTKYVLRSLRPGDMAEVIACCFNAINEGMGVEIQNTDVKDPVEEK